MWMDIKMVNRRQAGRGLCVLGLLIVLLFLPGFGRTEETKKSEPVKTATSTLPTAIPVPEVAIRATEVSDLIRSIKAKPAVGEEIDRIGKSFMEVSERIDREFIHTEKVLQSEPPLTVLQAEEQSWQRIQILTAGWLKTLTEEAFRLREATNKIASLEEIWTMTRGAARSSKAPAPVLLQIDEVIASLKEVEPLLKEQTSSVLDLQGRVAHAVARCDSVLARIAGVQHRAMGGIMTRNSVPIWDSSLWAHAGFTLKSRAGQAGAALWQDLSSYMRDLSRGMLFHLGVFVVLAVVFSVLRSRVRRWETDKQGISASLETFETPFAAASLGFLFFASGPQSSAPAMVKALLAVLAFAPMIRLIRPIVDPKVIPGLYALWVLFVLDTFRRVSAGTFLEGQSVLVLEAFVGMVVLSWSLFRGHLGRTARNLAGTGRDHALRAAAVLILLILGAAFVAGILGYLRLARILASEIVAGGTLALGLAVFVRIFTGVAAFALRTRPLTFLYMVRHYRDLLERRVHRHSDMVCRHCSW